jgi:hypothetical protein
MSSSNVGGLPLGVAILAILIGIFGFFVLLVGVLALVFGTGLALTGMGTVTAFGFGGAIAGLIVFIIGLVILGVAVGLWNQELWALALAVIVLLLYGVIEFLAMSWVALLIVVFLLVYLFAVSRHFD